MSYCLKAFPGILNEPPLPSVRAPFNNTSVPSSCCFSSKVAKYDTRRGLGTKYQTCSVVALEASTIFLHDQSTSMTIFNIPYEELDINEGRHQYEINCIGIKAINSAKSLEYSKGWLETLL